MKAWTIAAAGLVLMSGVGVAVAQNAANPPPPPAPPTAEAPGPRGPMDGPMGRPMGPPMGSGWGWRHHRMAEMMGHMPPPPPPSKAAHFRFRKDGALVDVKCAETESTKACVDAASALFDKITAANK